MVTRLHAMWLALAAMWLLVTPVRAETPLPRIDHAPISVAVAHQALVVTADIVNRDGLRHAYVVYRTPGEPELQAVELLRAPGEDAYAAEIPAKDVRVPAIAYTIELELTDGTAVTAFATRDAMHSVAVPEIYLDLRERALAKRLEGRRSVVTTSGEWVDFGKTPAFTQARGEYGIRDWYYRVDGACTYRPLRTLTEFTLHLGVLRGRAPAPYAAANDDLSVGMNYIAPSVLLRLGDAWHVSLGGLTAITEVGFELGVSAELLIGDPYGSKLRLGAESIDGFGARFWSRADIRATDRFYVSPIVEATNLPHADAYGVRLLLQLDADLGRGFGASLGGGYQARRATSGGAAASLALHYAF